MTLSLVSQTQSRCYFLWYSHPRTLGSSNITSGTIYQGKGVTSLTRCESYTHAPIAGRLCWGGGSSFKWSLVYLHIYAAANFTQYTVSVPGRKDTTLMNNTASSQSISRGPSRVRSQRSRPPSPDVPFRASALWYNLFRLPALRRPPSVTWKHQNSKLEVRSTCN